MAEGQGRSSGQGVKLLYIRDYLYAHATKEHPKNASHIKDYLMTKGISASEKTIYNDMLIFRPLSNTTQANGATTSPSRNGSLTNCG